MKTLFVLLGLACTASPALADDLTSWPDEATHKVYFLARPKVSVTVSNVGADDDYWDLVSVDVDYSNPRMDEYFNRMQLRYPGYQYLRLIMEAQGDFKLAIPVLGVNEPVKAMPGIDGPYMHWQAFVTRAKSDLVRRAIAQPGAVSVIENVSVTYKETKTLERVELDSGVCQELASRDGTLFGMLLNSRKVLAELDTRTFHYPDTKAALIRSIFDSCLELPADAGAGSVRNVLDTRIELRTRPSRPYGETKGEVSTPAVVPLKMDMVVTVAGQS